MRPDELAFRRQICESPADDTVRLVYADWLEEHGNVERAAFVRVQVEKARQKDKDHCPMCGLHWRYGVGSLDGPGQDFWCEADHGWKSRSYDELRRREQELFENGGTSSWGFPAEFPCTPFPDEYAKGRGPGIPIGLISRGFVSVVTLTAADWLAHADRLFWHKDQRVKCPECDDESPQRIYCKRCEGSGSAGTIPRPFPTDPPPHPVREVRLTTVPPEGFGGPAWGKLVHAYHDVASRDYEFESDRWPGVIFRISESTMRLNPNG